MKVFLSISAIILVLFTSCTSTQNIQDTTTTYTPVETVSYQQFYDGLSPYGRWMNYPGYGNVWVPVEQGFSPYSTNGHWVYTNFGWSWESGYQWGWAPFHYGRWFYDNSFGWVWTPGYEWAPAWVNWRGGNQYYGWAPMHPSGRYEDIDDEYWTFVDRRYINHRDVNNYYIRQNDNRTIINNTTVINNNQSVGKRTFNTGPSANEVEAVTSTKIRPIIITKMGQASSQQSNNGTLTTYKPIPSNDQQPNKRPAVTNTPIRQDQSPAPKRVFINPPVREDKPVQQSAPVIAPNPPKKMVMKEEPHPVFNNIPPVREQPVMINRDINKNIAPVQQQRPEYNINKTSFPDKQVNRPVIPPPPPPAQPKNTRKKIDGGV